MERTKIGFAVTALVLGIMGLVMSVIPIINNLAFFVGIIAAVFGIVALLTKNKKGLSIAGIVTGILAMVVTLVLQASYSKAINDATEELNDNLADMTGENTDQLLGTVVTVDLGTFTATTDEYGFVTSALPVTVTNISSDSASFSITIEALNIDGSRLDTAYVYADSLGAGQSMSEDVFTYFASEDLEAYQNATFQILEVSKY